MKDLILVLEGLKVLIDPSLFLQGLLIEIFFFLNAAESQSVRVRLELMDAGTDELVGSLQFVVEFL